jgi:hypothetical protein
MDIRAKLHSAPQTDNWRSARIQRQPLRAISFWQYRSQFLTVPRWLHVATQASSEHEFFPGSC